MPNREINKSALGATESVKWQYFEETITAIEQLRRKGYKIIAIEQATESVFLEDYTPKTLEKVALVFGNEVMGVNDQVMEEIDACI